LPSDFYRGTWQNIKKKFAECLGRHSAIFFRSSRRRPLKGILPSARPSTRKKNIFFQKTLPTAANLGTRQRAFLFLHLLCRVRLPQALDKEFFLFFKKFSLSSAPVQALGKELLNFLKKYTLPSALARHSANKFYIFLKKIFVECLADGTRQRPEDCNFFNFLHSIVTDIYIYT
jgi:hypothetical protein